MKINKYHIYLICGLLLLVGYLHISRKVEPYQGLSWSNKSIRDFLTFQHTVNPTTQFNMKMVQEQASEEELEELLSTGYWPWSETTQKLYMDAVSHNTMIKINPESSMDYVRKIYNEKATNQLLSWNTPEGQFLLGGVTLYINNNINNDINTAKDKIGHVKCKLTNDGNTIMKKTMYLGDNLWNGYKNTKTTVLKNEQLPQEIPGFQFIKGPCNPCVALDNDYRCPFEIDTNNTKKTNNISEIWRKLWSI